MKTQFLLFILCISALVGSAQRVTLSGTIRDSKTGEVLIGATVYAPDLKTGTITNAYASMGAIRTQRVKIASTM